MRRPIQIQLLLPTLSVVVLAIVLASGASGYFGAMRQRQSQEDSLRRVVATLVESRFPLTKEVLQQMSGLSGAEFVFLDVDKNVLARTMVLSAADEARLRDLAGQPNVELSGRAYLSQRTPVTRKRSRQGSGNASSTLFTGQMVGRDVAGGVSGARGRRGCGGCCRSGCHVAGSAFCAADSSIERSDGTDRKRRLHAGCRRHGRRRTSRSGCFDQSHDGAAWPVRARGPPQRAASHAQPARRRNGPPASQRGHRFADGDRTTPAARRQGDGGAGSGLAAASIDGVLLATISRTQPSQTGDPRTGCS